MSEATIIHEDEDDDYEIEWDLEADAKIQIKSNLKLNQQENDQFKTLISKIKQTIATDLSQLSKAKVATHTITLIDDSPTYVPQYRMSPLERQTVKTQCDEYLKAGIISKSKSPNSAPIILVKKRRVAFEYH